MKYLLVLVVVFIAVMIWRNNRRGLGNGAATRASRPATPCEPDSMVSCPVCAVHLPTAEAVQGRHGMYCSAKHRQQAEG